MLMTLKARMKKSRAEQNKVTIITKFKEDFNRLFLN